MSFSLKLIDYIVLILVLLISLSIGLYYGLKRLFIKSNEAQFDEYLMASGSLGAFPISLSLLASFFSATAILGFPSEVFYYGIEFWTCIFPMICTPLIGAFITGPLFTRLKILSVFEYLKIRFDSTTVRLIGVACYFTRNLISTSIYIYGPAITLFALTKISTPISILVIGSAATLYTSLGGIKAVIWTDVFQMCVMIIGMVFIIFIGLNNVGGLQEVLKINFKGGRLNFFDFTLNPFVRQSFWSIFFGVLFQFMMNYCIDQQMLQRFKSARTKRTAQLALLLNVPGIIFFVSLCCFTGLVLYANYYKCDPLISDGKQRNPNELLPYFISEKLSFLSGSTGLFLATVLCGSLSSVSSSLNSLSAILWEDFLKRFFSNVDDSRSTFALKILVVLCGAICTFLAFMVSNLGGNLVQISSTLNGSFNAPIVGVFILGFLVPFSNKYGAIFGTISGFLLSIWLSMGAYATKPKYQSLGFECSNMTLRYSKEATNLNGWNKFYSISYLWFSVFSSLTTIAVGTCVSLLTRRASTERRLTLYYKENKIENIKMRNISF